MRKAVKKTVKKRAPSQKKIVKNIVKAKLKQDNPPAVLQPAVQSTSLIPFDQLKAMAQTLGDRKLFGKTAEELLPLMLIAQAEGLHPAIAAQEYDIIQGKPAINSRAALARFQKSGGKIGWIVRNDKEASAIFEHPSCIGQVTITWTLERATKAGLTSKDNWRKYPAQMLSSRVVAEGVRACYPACLSGMYTVEEVQDIPVLPVKNITPDKPSEQAASQGFHDRNESSNTTRDVTPEPAIAHDPKESVEAKKRVSKVVDGFEWKGRAKEYQWVKNEIASKDFTDEYADTIIDHIVDLKLPPKEEIF